VLKAKWLLCLGVVLLMGRPGLGAEKGLQGYCRISLAMAAWKSTSELAATFTRHGGESLCAHKSIATKHLGAYE
jgi:hypothetical protein